MAQFLNKNDPTPKGTCKRTGKKTGLWKGFHEANCNKKGSIPKTGAKQSFKQTTSILNNHT